MYPIQKSIYFSRILVPVIHGCDQKSAINAAQAIAGRDNVLLTGFIYIPEGQSLSMATMDARRLRKTLKGIYKIKRGSKWAQVHVSHKPWDELIKVIDDEQPDLLILEWPSQFEALQTTVSEVLSRAPCNIAIVNQFIGTTIKNMLLPIRGGPYAELVLRIALSLHNAHKTELSSLHLFPQNTTREQDAAFRGIDLVLKNLPEIQHREIITDNPTEAIFNASQDYDLIMMGASARPMDETPSIGPVAEKVMQESRHGVIVVKTKLPYEFNPATEEAVKQQFLCLQINGSRKTLSTEMNSKT
mgnify:FL=1